MAPRPLSEEERYPFEEIKQYVIHRSKFETRSRNTILRVMSTLGMFGRAMVSLGKKTIQEVSRQDYILYAESYGLTRSTGSTKLVIDVLEAFWEWLIKEKRINESGRLGIPEPTTIKGSTPGIVKPETIFEMRQIIGVRLRTAMLIEMLLSSGMRYSEAEQVRPCDIMFSDSPIDISTGKPSMYVGGTIALKRESKSIKNDSSRVVYISKLARRLIYQYMDRNGLRSDSRVPLYPFSRQVFDDDANVLKDAIPELQTKDYVVRKMGTKSMDDFSLTGDESPELIQSLEKKVEKYNNFSGPADPLSSRDIIERERGLYPHKLRHSFACFQYYRTYYGEQRSTGRVSDMLGHGSRETTTVYLTQIDAIKSMKEWERLWIGLTSDWNRCI